MNLTQKKPVMKNIKNMKKNFIRFLALFITVITPVLLVNTVESQTPTFAVDEYRPRGIRLTVIHDPRHSVVVSWFTQSPALSPRVDYSENSDLSQAKEETPKVKAVDGTYIYTAELNNLLPDKTYFYKVESDDSNSRNIMHFRTAPERDVNHVEFLILGDTQNVAEVSAVLARKAMERFGDKIDFVVHVGDIVDKGNEQSCFNKYFEKLELLHRYKPCFFTEGNHENSFGNKMYKNIPLPSNGIDSRYYSFWWGPASFVSLNTSSYEILPHQTVSNQWLESELARFDKDKYSLWKLAYYHHPIFNSNKYRPDKYYLIPNWLALFDTFEVDLVFNGHNHYYQRTYPVNHERKINDSEKTHFTESDYPIYLICNSDRSLYDLTRGDTSYKIPDYVLFHKKIAQVCYVEISVDNHSKKTTLTLQSLGIPRDENLTLIDRFTITKELPEKYINSNYKTPEHNPYARMSSLTYLMLYLSVLGIILVVIDRPILQHYITHKRSGKRGDPTGSKGETNVKGKTALSLFLLAGLSVVFSYYFIHLDYAFHLVEILHGILVALLIMIPINFILLGKEASKRTVAHSLFCFCFTAAIAMMMYAKSYFFHLFYLNMIGLAVAGILFFPAFKLSRNAKPSILTGEDSFYLGGSLLFLELSWRVSF